MEGIGSSASSIMLTGEKGKVELIISYEVRCQQNYYSTDCSTYCVPSDNSMGHYNCDPSNGNKICLPGYQNPVTNCIEGEKASILITWVHGIVLCSFLVACALVCTGGGGICSESGVCECREGWSGADCGKAQCAVNCHSEGGYCNEPGECLCNTHWNGTNCNQYLCHPNCSTVGGTCEHTGGCDCLPEYTGGHCETGELQKFPLRFFHILLLFFVDLNPCTHLSPCENEGVSRSTVVLLS